MARQVVPALPAYTPLRWVLVSGDDAADAAYIMGLPNRGLRALELKRLQVIHGRDYATTVERLVIAAWRERN